jgi:hypothetical protein
VKTSSEAQDLAVGQWQLCENYGQVVMEMAWANVKIRHFFGFTSLTERSVGAGPPVIILYSSVVDSHKTEY